MRKLTKLLTGAAVAAIAASFAAAVPAHADPVGPGGKSFTPQAYDIVGVGSNTTEYLFDQFSVDYNSTVKVHNASHPYLGSWDAVLPGATTNAPTDITPKKGCKAIVRPNGSSAGLKALDGNAKDGKDWCIDFARSSSGRSATSPKAGPGGVWYVALAEDAVTYATRDKASGGTNAPSSLSIKDLIGIYDCTITNWKQVGGKSAPIDAFIPQSGSGTRSFWLKQLGLTDPGPCVNQKPEENEGEYAPLDSPDTIYIFSVGSYISQADHSAKCGSKPSKSQNEFGCDETGVLGLNAVDNAAGKPVSPTTGSGANTKINPAFAATTLTRTLYDIVRWATTASHIPTYLQSLFGSKGYLCTSATAKKTIASYGFLTVANCGVGS
jgi:ABC-type phosphate transport system substrate-binding protein